MTLGIADTNHFTDIGKKKNKPSDESWKIKTKPHTKVVRVQTLKRKEILKMLEKMKKKTYHNFLIVRNKLMFEKGYEPREAERITHRIFNNYQLDNTHTIKWYYDMVLTKEEFEMQY